MKNENYTRSLKSLKKLPITLPHSNKKSLVSPADITTLDSSLSAVQDTSYGLTLSGDGNYFSLNIH